MAKPSDLFNKTGTGGAAGGKPNPFAPIPGLSDKPADEKEAAKRLMEGAVDDPSNVTRKRDLGHNVHGDAHAKGGAGGASQRPKV
ncbi:MAG: hypothetical protein U0637_09595 [Phycisphaerales bacterium]